MSGPVDRETDRFLRKAVIYIPILSFIVGWGSGVITNYLVFKEHDRRNCTLETVQDRHENSINLIETRERSIMTVLKDRFHIDIN